MYWIGPILALVGLALLVYGFHKNSRGLLALAGVTLFLAGTMTDFIDGFVKGFSDVQSATAVIASFSFLA